MKNATVLKKKKERRKQEKVFGSYLRPVCASTKKMQKMSPFEEKKITTTFWGKWGQKQALVGKGPGTMYKGRLRRAQGRGKWLGTGRSAE